MRPAPGAPGQVMPSPGPGGRLCSCTLPLLGSGRPEHAASQGGYQHGTMGTPAGHPPWGVRYMAVGWAHGSALLSGTFSDHSSHQVGAQSRGWERVSIPFPEGPRKEARHARMNCAITTTLKTGREALPTSCRHAQVEHGNGLGTVRSAPMQVCAPPHLTCPRPPGKAQLAPEGPEPWNQSGCPP